MAVQNVSFQIPAGKHLMCIKCDAVLESVTDAIEHTVVCNKKDTGRVHGKHTTPKEWREQQGKIQWTRKNLGHFLDVIKRRVLDIGRAKAYTGTLELSKVNKEIASELSGIIGPGATAYTLMRKWRTMQNLTLRHERQRKKRLMQKLPPPSRMPPFHTSIKEIMRRITEEKIKYLKQVKNTDKSFAFKVDETEMTLPEELIPAKDSEIEFSELTGEDRDQFIQGEGGEGTILEKSKVLNIVNQLTDGVPHEEIIKEFGISREILSAIEHNGKAIAEGEGKDQELAGETEGEKTILKKSKVLNILNQLEEGVEHAEIIKQFGIPESVLSAIEQNKTAITQGAHRCSLCHILLSNQDDVVTHEIECSKTYGPDGVVMLTMDAQKKMIKIIQREYPKFTKGINWTMVAREVSKIQKGVSATNCRQKWNKIIKKCRNHQRLTNWCTRQHREHNVPPPPFYNRVIPYAQNDNRTLPNKTFLQGLGIDPTSIKEEPNGGTNNDKDDNGIGDIDPSDQVEVSMEEGFNNDVSSEEEDMPGTSEETSTKKLENRRESSTTPENIFGRYLEDSKFVFSHEALGKLIDIVLEQYPEFTKGIDWSLIAKVFSRYYDVVPAMNCSYKWYSILQKCRNYQRLDQWCRKNNHDHGVAPPPFYDRLIPYAQTNDLIEPSQESIQRFINQGEKIKSSEFKAKITSIGTRSKKKPSKPENSDRPKRSKKTKDHGAVWLDDDETTDDDETMEDDEMNDDSSCSAEEVCSRLEGKNKKPRRRRSESHRILHLETKMDDVLGLLEDVVKENQRLSEEVEAWKERRETEKDISAKLKKLTDTFVSSHRENMQQLNDIRTMWEKQDAEHSEVIKSFITKLSRKRLEIEAASNETSTE